MFLRFIKKLFITIKKHKNPLLHDLQPCVVEINLYEVT